MTNNLCDGKSGFAVHNIRFVDVITNKGEEIKFKAAGLARRFTPKWPSKSLFNQYSE